LARTEEVHKTLNVLGTFEPDTIPTFYWEGIKKNIKNVVQESWCSIWYQNQAPPQVHAIRFIAWM